VRVSREGVRGEEDAKQPLKDQSAADEENKDVKPMWGPGMAWSQRRDPVPAPRREVSIETPVPAPCREVSIETPEPAPRREATASSSMWGDEPLVAIMSEVMRNKENRNGMRILPGKDPPSLLGRPPECFMMMMQSRRKDLWKCRIRDCKDSFHALTDCAAFKQRPVAVREAIVRRLEICGVCLTWGHGYKAGDCIHQTEFPRES